MAITFDQILTRVRAQLLGFTKDQEQFSSLAVAVNPTDTTITVDTATIASMGRGTWQIDEELILIKSVDATSGVATVMAGLNGRGREGTTAASHALDTLVTNAPAFPNIRIREAINDVILATYPHLVVYGDVEISKLAPVIEYGLPSEARDIWYVVNQLVGPTKIWQPATNWRFNPRANTTDFPTGKSIQLLDVVTPGRAMRVTYIKTAQPLVNPTDDFETVSGLPERCADMIVYGTIARLLPSYEAARLQQRAIEATERAPLVPPRTAAQAAQYFQALYERRLAEERDLQFLETPNYQHWNGS